MVMVELIYIDLFKCFYLLILLKRPDMVGCLDSGIAILNLLYDVPHPNLMMWY